MVRTALFLLGVLALVALNLGGCGASGGAAQPRQGSAAASAQKSFEDWAQGQGTPYQNARYETPADDGAFATVRITAEFRPTAKDAWREQEAQVECRKVGSTWQCDQDFDFAVTAAQETREAQAYQATATAEVAMRQATATAEVAMRQATAEVAMRQATAEVAMRQRTAVAAQVIATAEAPILAQMPPIAFMSNRDGNEEIYVMAADGSNQVNLTNNSADDDSPAWSPDGSRIAFVSNRDGGFGGMGEIYVMNADGSNPVNLTNNPAYDRDPAWAPRRP